MIRVNKAEEAEELATEGRTSRSRRLATDEHGRNGLSQEWNSAYAKLTKAVRAPSTSSGTGVLLQYG
jgi:hypothetical protein